jgi:hypothetical protein
VRFLMASVLLVLKLAIGVFGAFVFAVHYLAVSIGRVFSSFE